VLAAENKTHLLIELEISTVGDHPTAQVMKFIEQQTQTAKPKEKP